MTKHVFQTTFAGRELIVETGQVAKQANGSVVVRYGESTVLTAAVMSKKMATGGFLPRFKSTTINSRPAKVVWNTCFAILIPFGLIKLYDLPTKIRIQRALRIPYENRRLTQCAMHIRKSIFFTRDLARVQLRKYFRSDSLPYISLI